VKNIEHSRAKPSSSCLWIWEDVTSQLSKRREERGRPAGLERITYYVFGERDV
jgi:hypothetical protein